MLTLELISEARQSANTSNDWLTQLVNRFALPRTELLVSAAELTGYPLLDIENGWFIEPAFEQVSYTDMVERVVLVGFNQMGQLCAVIGLPLEPLLGAWLSRLCLHEIYLADPLSIQSKLDFHESAFSAVADAVGLDEQFSNLA